MSYSSFVQKFLNEDSDFVPLVDVGNLLNGWGEIVERKRGFELVRNDFDLFEVCFLSGSLDTGISGFIFERPQNHPNFYELVFLLLSIKNTCYFGPDLDFVLSRSEMNTHYPPELLSNAQPTMVFNPDEIKLVIG